MRTVGWCLQAVDDWAGGWSLLYREFPGSSFSFSFSFAYSSSRTLTNENENEERERFSRSDGRRAVVGCDHA